MQVISKHLFEAALRHEPCELMHPWTKSCKDAYVTFFKKSGKGSFVFFTANYLIQLLMRYKKMEGEDYKLLLKNYLRSCLMGTIHGSTFFILNCLFRNLLGSFYYSVMFLVVPFLMGVNIFIDHPSRRNIVTVTFISLSTQALYTKYRKQGNLPKSNGRETLYFMILNAVLMYILNKRRSIKPVLWFFRPPKPEYEEGKACPHKSSCVEYIGSGFLQFFKLGLAISCIKVISRKKMVLLQPVQLMRDFFKLKNFQLALFAGAYVGLYKGISCLLCNVTMQDNINHALIAGLVSGLSFAMNPNTGLLFTLLAVTMRVTGEELKNRFDLPELPYTELSFAICNAILFCLRVTDSNSIPSYGSYLLKTFCGGLDVRLMNYVVKKLQDHKKLNEIP